MRIAIDIDGTLSSYPETFAQWLDLMPEPEIVLLTGSLIKSPPVSMASLMDGRKEQVRALIGDRINRVRIHICGGKNTSEVAVMKGKYCRDNDVSIFVDDTALYCDWVRKMATNTVVLQVVK